MPKRKASYGGGSGRRVPPPRPADPDRSRRTGAFFILAGIALLAVVAGTLAFMPLWRSGPAQRDAQPASWAAVGQVLLSKPPRPEFQLSAEASATQHLVAELRDKSFEVAERLVDAFPNSPHALHVLGTVHQRHRNEAGAAQLWRSCLQLDPGFAAAHGSLGRLALAKSDDETAEMHLRRALEIQPESAIVPLQLAELLMPRGSFADAAAVLEAFVTHHPDSAEGWTRLGQAYHQQGDAENAQRCHLEAIRLDPEHFEAYYGAGLALQKRGEFEQAAKYLEEFQRRESQRPRMSDERAPDRGDELRMRITLTNTYMAAADVYAHHSDLEAAEEHWLEAAQSDSEHRESRLRLAELYQHLGRYREALRFCRELRDLEPNDPMVWLILGVVAVRNRQLEEAETALRRTIELAPHHAETYAVLAQIQMLPDRSSREAVSLARTAVELQPSAGHYYILGTARWHAGDVATARTDLARAVELEPDNAEYRNAYAYLRQEP